VAAPPVMVAPAEAMRIEDRIEATGELRAQNAAAVAAQVGGQVTKLVRDEGGRGRGGRNRDRDRPRAAQPRARQRARGWRRRPTRRPAKPRATSTAWRSSTRRAWRPTRSSTRSAPRCAPRAARATPRRRSSAWRSARCATPAVKAPFAGLVARRYVSQGEFVQPGQKLFELVALDPIEVEFHLPERDSSLRAQVAQPSRLRTGLRHAARKRDACATSSGGLAAPGSPSRMRARCRIGLRAPARAKYGTRNPEHGLGLRQHWALSGFRAPGSISLEALWMAPVDSPGANGVSRDVRSVLLSYGDCASADGRARDPSRRRTDQGVRGLGEARRPASGGDPHP